MATAKTSAQTVAAKAAAKKNPLNDVLDQITEQIDPAVFDDMRFLELLDVVDKGTDPLALARIFIKILGPEKKEKLYAAIETENGTVPIAAASSALLEIMRRVKVGKKS